MISRIGKVLLALAQGMGLTFKKLLGPKYTMQYPEERWHVAPTFRGMPVLLPNPETGTAKCTACGICARNCPVDAIAIESETGEDRKKKLTGYSVDMARCIVCGLCAESCPFNGLTMANEYELAGYTREQLVYTLPELLAIGSQYTFNNQKDVPQSVFTAYFAEGGFCCLQPTAGEKFVPRVPLLPGSSRVTKEVSQR